MTPPVTSSPCHPVTVSPCHPVTLSGLAGKRIVVTRSVHQADELDDLLRGRGAEPLPYPCIAIAPPAALGPLDAALRAAAAGAFDWLALTSSNTAAALAERWAALGLAPGDLRRVAVAAVGSATARAVERLFGVTPALTPPEFVAEALAAALSARGPANARILLCQADLARPALAEALRTAGWAVTTVVAYRTVIGSGGIRLAEHLAAGAVDAITFTSPSTVHNLAQRLAAEGGRLADLAGVGIACLGPVTAAAARQAGLPIHALCVPAEHTIPALVDALDAYFTEK
jgi:uroporphyrinogen-III synthase